MKKTKDRDCTNHILPKFSVLMAVYEGECPQYFRESLQSLVAQTLPPTEVVIVKDGPLKAEHEQIIVEFENVLILKVISLAVNKGLGGALAIGLENCTYEIVARMDSDDIAYENRFEVELRYLSDNLDIDVVGSWITEFVNDRNAIDSHRCVATGPADVNKFARWRCPINHMTVMYRKRAVLTAGGYDSKFLQEDYWLWVRMISLGFQLANMPVFLVHVRLGANFLSRRGGLRYAISEVALQRHMLRIGFISVWQFIRNILVRVPVRILPKWVRKRLYVLSRRENVVFYTV